MIIQLAGLPGTGKTTLATGLSRELGALILDKDRVRQAVFTSAVTYTREQDDLCVSFLFQAAHFLFQRDPDIIVIFDGRTCLRAYQVEHVRALAKQARQPLHIVECVCTDTTARRRLQADTDHVAANRSVALYETIRATADPIPDPKIVLSTEMPSPAVLDQCLYQLGTVCQPRCVEAQRAD